MSGSRSDIEALVDQAARLLPEQGPLTSFVHHNTLHAFEELSFDEAVIRASEIFGTEPYQSEAAFRDHVENGRILSVDIESELEAEMARQGIPDPIVGERISRREFRSLRLRHLFEMPRGCALDWHLVEGEALRALHPMVEAPRARALEERARRSFGELPDDERIPALLSKLWMALESAALPKAPPRVLVRRRDQILAAGGPDIDAAIQPLLIRLCAAFLDQGISSWPMPQRDSGFLEATRRLLAAPFGSPDPLRRAIAREFKHQATEKMDAATTVARALDDLAIAEKDRGAAILESLLSLRGWAGMMRQFELRPDRAPIAPLPAKLIDFLAVLLSFEAQASRAAVRALTGKEDGWSALRPEKAKGSDRSEIFEGHVLAQIAEVDVDSFDDPEQARAWMEEIRNFDGLARRQILHRAYERRLGISLLDGIAAHTPQPDPKSASFQAVFCIDDRECSTRRHLEELHPDCATFGYAGFYGVAMAWQSLADVRPAPLCPVNIRPSHFVTERALDSDELGRWDAIKKRRGFVMDTVTSSSRRPLRGALATTLGLWSMVPMIGRCLFPRLAHRWAGRVAETRHEPVTRLELWREDETRDAEGRFVGYSHVEAADVVEGMLRTIGLESGFAEIVAIVGHGSSSLNNPHRAAYDCGATGGGRGGPNARAFAMMANEPGVRALLRERGLEIPDSTWFVGAYHNTCDDAVSCFDEDLIPEERVAAAAAAITAIDEASALDAHERCRRFMSAPQSLDSSAARMHAEERSVDLAQPRPECGHATNAYAIVGRRSLTRGLFLDRRAFLVSYDPTRDPEGSLLAILLSSVVPVGAGINLEYYFSYVDPAGYGCGTKLPHNITGLIGVMDGHRSDLRTGLPWQMVEIHEPVRLHAVIEAETRTLERILADHPDLARFIDNGWILLSACSPETGELARYEDGAFRPYTPELRRLPLVSNSSEFYRRARGNLGLASIHSSRLDRGASPERPQSSTKPVELSR